jgi:hypothetical protein
MMPPAAPDSIEEPDLSWPSRGAAAVESKTAERWALFRAEAAIYLREKEE